MSTRRVLITGMGGDLAQALAKCVRLMDESIVVIGTDCVPHSIGAAFANTFHMLPRADEENYLRELSDLCRRERCDALVPGSVPEMATISYALAERKTDFGCPTICQPHAAIAMHGDKLLSYQFLKGKVPLVGFADGSDPVQGRMLARSVGFPLVIKPRVSSGSRAVCIVNDEDALTKALQQIPYAVIQQYIHGDTEEYSVGLFTIGGRSHAVAFRRVLGPVGASWYAETSDDKHVLDYCHQVGQALGLSGSYNIQVRKRDEDVLLLEINPRFSSLVAARAYCGFRDLEWSLRQAWGAQLDIPSTFAPLRFRRFFHELVDLGAGYHAPKCWHPADETHTAGRLG